MSFMKVQRLTDRRRKVKKSEKSLFDLNARNATGISVRDVGRSMKMSDSDNFTTIYFDFLCLRDRTSVSSSQKQLKSLKSYEVFRITSLRVQKNSSNEYNNSTKNS